MTGRSRYTPLLIDAAELPALQVSTSASVICGH